MNTQALCKATGLTPRKVEDWLECGLIEPIPGWRREFSDDQVLRVALVRVLQTKGVELAQLAGRNLNFPNEKYLIFDGSKLHGCPDAEAAIAAAVRAKRWCSAVDLASVRRASA